MNESAIFKYKKIRSCHEFTSIGSEHAFRPTGPPSITVLRTDSTLTGYSFITIEAFAKAYAAVTDPLV